MDTTRGSSAHRVATLIDYYLRCLEVERRYEAEFTRTAMDREVFPLRVGLRDDWQCVLADNREAAARCQAAALRTGAPVLFSLLVRVSLDRLSPVAGVFGTLAGVSFLPEPESVVILRPLDNELPEE